MKLYDDLLIYSAARVSTKLAYFLTMTMIRENVREKNVPGRVSIHAVDVLNASDRDD